MILDSTHVFRDRAEAINMPTRALDALIAAGVDTLSNLAFSSSYQHGAPDDSPLLRVLALAVGDAATQLVPITVQENAALRRLFFEAVTVNMSEMRTRIERAGDAAPKRLPAAERSARYDAQVLRLNGLCLTGELECAHSLVDAVFQQKEDEVVRYLAPENCPKRSQELVAAAPVASKVLDLTKLGPVAVTTVECAFTADVSTELRVRSALTRRALAYDQCSLVEFKFLEAWSDYLFAQLMRAPLAGFNWVTMQQILQADRQLFQVAAEATRSGISMKANGDRPLQAALLQARNDPQVMLLLMPNKGSSSAAFPPPPPSLPKVVQVQNPPGSGRAKKLARLALLQLKGQEKGGKGGKGKGKGQEKGRMPAGLEGMLSRDDHGVSICYSFNLAGCSNEVSNGRCSRGRHCCCRPGCLAEHPLSRCPART